MLSVLFERLPAAFCIPYGGSIKFLSGRPDLLPTEDRRLCLTEDGGWKSAGKPGSAIGDEFRTAGGSGGKSFSLAYPKGSEQG